MKEYKVIQEDYPIPLENALNEAAKEGWEIDKLSQVVDRDYIVTTVILVRNNKYKGE